MKDDTAVAAKKEEEKKPEMSQCDIMTEIYSEMSQINMGYLTGLTRNPFAIRDCERANHLEYYMLCNTTFLR